MVTGRRVILLVVVLALTFAGICEAQFLSAPNIAANEARTAGIFEREPGFYLCPGIKKFINSFASYEFPYAPGDIGKSRLEFPIDNWFGGFQFNKTYRYMSFNAEFWCRLNEQMHLKMQDSDWEDGVYPPDQKTAFSESRNRVPSAYLLDFNMDWDLPYVSALRVRPVVGVRYQRFHFIAGDGFQNGLPLSQFPTEPLQGDVYDDTFTFLQFYLGGKSCLWLGPVLMTLQADYAWIKADQDDLHLLRGLYRIADNGSGYCWHLAASLTLGATDFMSFRLQGDFMRLTTTRCPHTWWDTGVSGETWGGARIWSDQQSVTGYAELRF
jgi:outer membrane protease